MAEIVMAIDASAKTISAHVGDEIVLCFDENPTTGYLWHQTSSLPAGLALAGDEFRAKGHAMGSGGQRRFRYRCGSRLSGSLRFELARPWQAAQVARVSTVDISCD